MRPERCSRPGMCPLATDSHARHRRRRSRPPRFTAYRPEAGSPRRFQTRGHPGQSQSHSQRLAGEDIQASTAISVALTAGVEQPAGFGHTDQLVAHIFAVPGEVMASCESLPKGLSKLAVTGDDFAARPSRNLVAERPSEAFIPATRSARSSLDHEVRHTCFPRRLDQAGGGLAEGIASVCRRQSFIEVRSGSARSQKAAARGLMIA